VTVRPVVPTARPCSSDDDGMVIHGEIELERML